LRLWKIRDALMESTVNAPGTPSKTGVKMVFALGSRCATRAATALSPILIAAPAWGTVVGGLRAATGARQSAAAPHANASPRALRVGPLPETRADIALEMHVLAPPGSSD
jgi:hypothetical protein